MTSSLWIAVGLLSPLTGWSLDLVLGGVPQAQIVLPANAAVYTAASANWLQTYVQRCTGATLPLVIEGADKGPGTRIYVGPTLAAAQAGIQVSQLPWDGCRLLALNGNLFLLGHDEHGVVGQENIGPKGTCRAVVTFLEAFCGVRWLVPTPIGELTPADPDLTVPDNFDDTVVPAFGYGWGRTAYGVGNPAAFANNCRAAVRAFMSGGNNWSTWVPVNTYYASHPEYFALIDGARSTNPASFLDTSNPDVKQVIIDGIRQKFDAGYDMVELGQSDCYKRCQCPTCEALDNYRSTINTPTYWYQTLRDNPCERVLLFHRDIAAACLLSHPNKKVQILSYAPTLWPSQVFDQFPSNVVAELCNQDPQIVGAWQGAAAGLTAYVYYWGTFHSAGPGPKFTAAQVAQSFRTLRDQGFQGVYFCGSGECWGLEGPAYYACGRLLADPDQDPQALVAEYCRGIYGPAASVMISFFQTLDPCVQLYNGIEAQLGPLDNPEDAYCGMYPSATLDRLESLLHTAESRATNSPASDWVHLTRLTFNYVKLTAQGFSQYRWFKSAPDMAKYRAMLNTVQQWTDLKSQIVNLPAADINRWFPGQAAWVRFFNSTLPRSSMQRPPFSLDLPNTDAGFQAARLLVTTQP